MINVQSKGSNALIKLIQPEKDLIYLCVTQTVPTQAISMKMGLYKQIINKEQS